MAASSPLKLAVVGEEPAAAAPADLVRIDRVSKVFSSSRGTVTALSDVSMTIGTGEFVAIVGPSGCGKSTLLRLLCGLEQPSEGAIGWPGAMPGRGARCGVAFQDHRLLPWMSVEDNILLPRLMKGRATAQDRDRARDLCRLVGLGGFEGKRPAELSGGMRQRASFARAMFSEPDILLLDEPFGALDALTRERITGDAEAIWMRTGFTCLLITHSIGEAVHLADRVIVMSPRPGRIEAVVPVPLPRPRTPQIGSDGFNEIVNDIRGRLRHGDEDE